MQFTRSVVFPVFARIDRHTNATETMPASQSKAGAQVNVLLPTNVTAQVHSWEAIRRLLYSNKAAALHSFADKTIVARSRKRKRGGGEHSLAISKCCTHKARRFNCQRICYTDASLTRTKKTETIWSLYVYECTGCTRCSVIRSVRLV